MVVLEREGVPCLEPVVDGASADPARQAERALPGDQLPVGAPRPLPLAQLRTSGGRIAWVPGWKERRMRIFGLNAFVVLPIVLVTVLVVCAIVALVKYIVKK